MKRSVCNKNYSLSNTKLIVKKYKTFDDKTDGSNLSRIFFLINSNLSRIWTCECD